MNYFKFWIGDYQSATVELSLAEHGAYMLMLAHYYSTEKPLPVGKALYRALRADNKPERDAIDRVASMFWTATEQGLVNARADEEIERSKVQAKANQKTAVLREQAKKQARAGAKTGHEPWHEKSTNRAQPATEGHQKTGPKVDEKWDFPELFEEDFCSQVFDFAGTGEHDSCTYHSHSHSHINNPSITDGIGTLPSAPEKPGKPARLDEPPITPIPDSRYGPVAVSRAPTINPGRAGAAVAAMRAEGLADANASHPVLLALLDAGAGLDLLALAARKAVDLGKPYVYALSAAKGMLADAERAIPAARTQATRASPQQSYRERDEEAARQSMAQWAPRVAAKPRAAQGAHVIDGDVSVIDAGAPPVIDLRTLALQRVPA